MNLDVTSPNVFEDVTVVIPHIPVRQSLLSRALKSIIMQEVLPLGINVVADTSHEGAAATRNRGLDAVTTGYVAFLDDDDYFKPWHLKRCMEMIRAENADIVYPWFDVDNGTDPLGMEGKPFDPEHLKISNFIPVTVVARTDALVAAGGFTPHPDALGHPNEDWGCWLAVHNGGGKIVHLPERTWNWDHNSGNTSGRGDRW